MEENFSAKLPALLTAGEPKHGFWLLSAAAAC